LKITLELYRNRTIADSLGSRKLHAEHSDIEVEQVQQLSHHNEEQSTYQDVEQKSSGRIKEKLTEMRTTIKKNESVIAKLKELLVSSLKENQRVSVTALQFFHNNVNVDNSFQLEIDLRRKTLRAEEFETQLTEMSLLYNVRSSLFICLYPLACLVLFLRLLKEPSKPMILTATITMLAKATTTSTSLMQSKRERK
jgi:hypothetical protein